MKIISIKSKADNKMDEQAAGTWRVEGRADS